MPDVATKRCPYCAEEIRPEAVKCRYCGSMVEGGTPLSRTWYRVQRGKMLAGVCIGLAEQFGVSVSIVRLAFLLSALIGGGIGVIIYIALWVVMPYRDEIAFGDELGPRSSTDSPSRAAGRPALPHDRRDAPPL